MLTFVKLHLVNTIYNRIKLLHWGLAPSSRLLRCFVSISNGNDETVISSTEMYSMQQKSTPTHVVRIFQPLNLRFLGWALQQKCYTCHCAYALINSKLQMPPPSPSQAQACELLKIGLFKFLPPWAKNFVQVLYPIVRFVCQMPLQKNCSGFRSSLIRLEHIKTCQQGWK